MSNFKATTYAVMLVMLTACSKENTTPVSEAAKAENANADARWWNPDDDDDDLGTSQETIFGVIQEITPGQTSQEFVRQNQDAMDEAGVKLTRVSIVLAETTRNPIIDDLLNDGYNVQIIVNWRGGENGYRAFPKDGELDLFKTKAESFFKYYSDYKDQIPFVAIQNEWNYQVVHGSNLQDYIAELAAITPIAHKYGFKVADGGITSAFLQRWTYSQLSGKEQEQWSEDYWIGLNSGQVDYNDVIDITNTYIAGVKNIDFDYSNVHWGNAATCGDGFATATQLFMEACNKNTIVCNEFYIRTNSLDLFNATVNEIEGNVKYAIAYSGTNEDDLAIKFTDAMLEDLVK